MNKRIKSNESSKKRYRKKEGKENKQKLNSKRYYRTLVDNSKLNSMKVVQPLGNRKNSYAQFLKRLIDRMDERFAPLLGSFLKKIETVHLAYYLNDDNIIDTS